MDEIERFNQPINQLTIELVVECTIEPLNERVNEWINGQICADLSIEQLRQFPRILFST